MGPKAAEEKLISSRRVRKGKRGPASQQFTSIEKECVRILAEDGHSQQTIAYRAGLSLSEFKRALLADTQLREAWETGIAEERLRIVRALRKTAFSSTNPRQIPAAGLLAKMRHGFSESGGSSATSNVNVAINLPAPQDARKYQAIINRTQKNAPAVIEHQSTIGPPEPLDPIASVKRRQQEARPNV
jgi:hypothetical protein